MTDSSGTSKSQSLHCIGYSPTLSGFGVREGGPEGELVATFRRERDARAYAKHSADDMVHIDFPKAWAPYLQSVILGALNDFDSDCRWHLNELQKGLSGEWSECSNKTIDLARDADAGIAAWTERTAEMAALLTKWVIYCDLSGVKPVSGDLRDNPILALIADTRATLAKPVPSSGPETPTRAPGDLSGVPGCD